MGACGFLAAPAAPIDTAEPAQTPPAVVQVSNVDEFLAAIGSDTEIILTPGSYNLTHAADYGKETGNRYYNWTNVGSGQYGLEIKKADNLRITGSGAEIVTVPRWVNVLSFYKCDDLKLTSLTIGHTEATEACEGGVVFLDRCDDVIIDNCGLYGCGTIGVNAEDCCDLTVKNTDIYHCSSVGINLSNSEDVNVSFCRIYDCGNTSEYGAAFTAFDFADTSDVSVSDCEVYDNNFYSLINEYRSHDIKIDRLNVHNNRLNSAFCQTYAPLSFTDLTLTDNIINAWFEDYSTIRTIMLNGEVRSESVLVRIWGDQLSSHGIATVEVEECTLDYSGTKEVHVKTADEFLAAIASNTTVYIDVPQINLMDASDYGEGTKEDDFYYDTPLYIEFKSKPYQWRRVFDGCSLLIGGVKNFHIVGGEIVTEPRYAQVLSFYYCSELSFENLYLGHTKEEGSCTGGVLYLFNCEDVVLENCDLYGCGILGITAYGTKNMSVQRTLIHDCSYGAADFYDCSGINFFSCNVQNCPNPHFSLNNCTGFTWDGTLMDPNCRFNVTPGSEPSVFSSYES